MTVKTHAKDYLVPFAEKQDVWWKFLVLEAVRTNGQISDEKLEQVYLCLKGEQEPEILDDFSYQERSNDTLRLSKLTHYHGVGALAQNQTLIFSEHVTVLYGLNGAGKSSYFRVLNEIVGGNEEKEIKSNIYDDEHQPVRVELTYYDGAEKTLTYDQTDRGLPPLTSCKVFDTSYLRGLLSQRAPDELVLTPLGLHLFGYIVAKIEEFRKRLRRDADVLRNRKPTVKLNDLSEALQREIREHAPTPATVDRLRSNIIFSEKDAKLLAKTKSQITELSQTNYQDRVRVLHNDNEALRKISKVHDAIKSIKKFGTSLKTQHVELGEKIQTNTDALAKISILKELSSVGSAEWKEFIEAGARLQASDPTSDEFCLYCHQPLNDESLKIIQAYADYLGDKSENELKKTYRAIEAIKKNIENLSLTVDLPADFVARHTDDGFYGKDAVYVYESVHSVKKSFQDYKTYLLNYTLEVQNKLPPLDYASEWTEWSICQQQENEESIRALKTSENEKADNLNALTKTRDALLEQRSLANQKSLLTDWLDLHERELRLKTQATELDTRRVSRLSTQAHDELLTQELGRVFQHELELLLLSPPQIEVVKGPSVKGKSTTKLILHNHEKVDAILSEGEQKAVGLALFLAEASVQESKSPIILDDPVNSLDHRIAAKFADRLLSFDRQVIVFNHNRLFQDAFEVNDKVHICKLIDGSCSKGKNMSSKHLIFHEIRAEDLSVKGVVGNYRGKSYNNLIHEIKELIRESPFEKHQKTANLVREAIEAIIDKYILKSNVPTKYSNKKSRINWEQLKKLQPYPDQLIELKKLHGRISGGRLHRGTESDENPVGVEEFRKIVTDLEMIAKSCSG